MKRSRSETAKPVSMLDDNMTIRVPSMEAFAEMARASSTPFHGRVFLPEEDENTCNVELVYKKPATLSGSKNPSSTGPAPFEIYCDEEPEKVLAKPDFVKPLPMPKFCLKQPLTCDDRENKLGECCSQCFTVKMQLG